MQKFALLHVAFITGITLHAQNFAARPAQPAFGFKPKIQPLAPYRPYFLPADTTYVNNQPGAAKNSLSNVDNMPVKDINSRLAYVGLGANGVQVFMASPDFMPVIKPRKDFYSPMPVVNPATNASGGY